MMASFRPSPTLITYLVVAFMTAFVFLTHPGSVGFNSDSMYLPALFEDLFDRGYHLSSWYLTPAPYFFPDMLVFFIIKTCIKSVFYAFLVYAIFQTVLILYLISKIAFLVSQKRASVFLTHILFLLALFFAYSGQFEAYCIFLKSAHHTGTLINGLFLIYFLVLNERNRNKNTLWVIFLISILGTVSDLIFLVQFVLPIVVSLLLCQFFKSPPFFSIKRIILTLVLGCIIGFCSRHIVGAVAHFNYLLVHAFGVFETYQKIYLIFKDAFFAAPFLGVMTLIFYFILIVQCLIKMFSSYQKSWAFFLSLFVLISTLFTLESMSINGILSARYLLNIFWFPVFFFWILLPQNFNEKILLVILYAISVMIVASRIAQRPVYVFDYTPEIVRCIDAHIHEYNSAHNDTIKYGISTYWQEKLTTSFSKEGVIISQYTSNLKPRLWITSAENYRNAYDFAILSKEDMLDVNLIEKINGAPTLVFKCSDNFSLLIYGKNRLRVPDGGIK